ncbi:MAG: hypothetical protein QOE33_3032 [Acidobacteriota bacterium]|nr:hypothetical protein [Acidobacteriota bacterium]
MSDERRALRLHFIAARSYFRVPFFQIIRHQKHNADCQPEGGFHPVACLQSFQRGDAEEKQEDREVRAEFDPSHKHLHERQAVSGFNSFSRQRTISTEQEACAETACETEPSSIRSQLL